jgi:hypothetical protein
MSYYDNASKQYGDEISIEVAILQADITLPELPKEKLTTAVLKEYSDAGKTYDFPWQVYDDVIGNFYIPILFPLVENGDSTELEFKAPETKTVLNKSIKTVPYVERNYISLMIPKYIAMEYVGTIPAGTKFLVAFIGGSTSINNMSIIGIYGQDL